MEKLNKEEYLDKMIHKMININLNREERQKVFISVGDIENWKDYVANHYKMMSVSAVYRFIEKGGKLTQEQTAHFLNSKYFSNNSKKRILENSEELSEDFFNENIIFFSKNKKLITALFHSSPSLKKNKAIKLFKEL